MDTPDQTQLAEGPSSPPRSTSSASSKPYPPSPLLKDRMAQLRQSATCQDALLSLNQIVREMQPSAVPRFLTHLQSETGSPRKLSYAHHAISLYVSLAKEHREKLIPQIPRVMRNLMLHLKSPGVGIVGSPGGGGGESSVHGACAQVVLELARIPTEDEQAGAQLLQDICSPLIGALSKSENGPQNGVPTESFGAAHCLKALIDSEDVWRRASDGLVDDVCSETAEVLRVDGAAVFLQLACSLARSNISVCQHYAGDLLQAAADALQWRTASWQQRFAAAKLYTELLSRAEHDVAASLSPSALEALENCRTSDQSAYVREQAVDAIRALESRSLLRDSHPSLPGPRTPDASPPRRTPQASPPQKPPATSAPQTGSPAHAKPTLSAESPKITPKRSKLEGGEDDPRGAKRTAVVLASVEWPSGEVGGAFGGSPIYEGLEESDESPLLLLRSRGVTSQGSGKMSTWSVAGPRAPSAETQGLRALAEGGGADWRRNAKLMQSAEWPAGGSLFSGSPVYDPEDFDLTSEGVEERPGEAPGAFRPAAQLGRTPHRALSKSPLSEPGTSGELSTPGVTPVVVMSRTPHVPVHPIPLNGLSDSETAPPSPDSTSAPPFSESEAAPPSAESEAAPPFSESEAAPASADSTPAPPLSKSESAPPSAESEDTNLGALSQRTPGSAAKPLGVSDSRPGATASEEERPVSVSKIPRPPSARTDLIDSPGSPGDSPPLADSRDALSVNVQGAPANPSSPSDHNPSPEKSPTRIPTPTRASRPKASIVGSNIPPPPSLSKLKGPQFQAQKRQQEEALSEPRSPAAQQGELEQGARKRAPVSLLKKGSFEERLRQVADKESSGGLRGLDSGAGRGRAGTERVRRLIDLFEKEPVGKRLKSEEKDKGQRISRRKSSLGPSDFLSTSPRQMIRRLASESPASAKHSPVTTPKSVLALHAPGGRLPGSLLAQNSSASTPPETPGEEPGRKDRQDRLGGQLEGSVKGAWENGDGENGLGENGDGENGLLLDMEIDEDKPLIESPGVGESKEQRRAEMSEKNMHLEPQRRWSVNGGKGAARYSLEEESGSETEPEGKEPGSGERGETLEKEWLGKATGEDLGLGSKEAGAGSIEKGEKLHEEGSEESTGGDQLDKKEQREGSGESAEVKGAFETESHDEGSGESTGEDQSLVSPEAEAQETRTGEEGETEGDWTRPQEVDAVAFVSKASEGVSLDPGDNQAGNSIPPVEDMWTEPQTPAQNVEANQSSASLEAGNMWCVHENPIAASGVGRPSLSPPWEPSESTLEAGKLRRMSCGEEVSSPEPPEGLGVWEEPGGLEDGKKSTNGEERMGSGLEVWEEAEGLGEEKMLSKNEVGEILDSEDKRDLDGTRKLETGGPGGEETPAKGGVAAGDSDASKQTVVTDRADEGTERTGVGAQIEEVKHAAGSEKQSALEGESGGFTPRDVVDEAAGDRGDVNKGGNEMAESGQEAGVAAPAVEEPLDIERSEAGEGSGGSGVNDSMEERDDTPVESGKATDKHLEAAFPAAADVRGSDAGEAEAGEVSGQGENGVTNEDVPRVSPSNPSPEKANGEEMRSSFRVGEADSSPGRVKKRVTFSEHNEYQMIAPNPPVSERVLLWTDQQSVNRQSASLREWVCFTMRVAEKGVKNAVIAIATVEVGAVLWAVSRGLWDAYCAPTVNVPLPS